MALDWFNRCTGLDPKKYGHIPEIFVLDITRGMEIYIALHVNMCFALGEG